MRKSSGGRPRATTIRSSTVTVWSASIRRSTSTATQFERRLIGQRTRDALAVKRAQGVTLGRPREQSTEAIVRIQALHHDGLSLAGIARTLNEEGIETPRGGSWFPSGVKRVLSWAA